MPAGFAAGWGGGPSPAVIDPLLTRPSPSDRPAGEACVPGGFSVPTSVSESSPLMKASTRSRPTSSGIWWGGLFMKYADGATSVPLSPRSSPSLRQRIASVMTPAELGESQTSSFSSALSGTSP